jgi:CheY-like chemotaxis protein
VRANPEIRATRLIAISGYVRDMDIARAREAGFDAHLAKPLEFAELRKLMAMPN